MMHAPDAAKFLAPQALAASARQKAGAWWWGFALAAAALVGGSAWIAARQNFDAGDDPEVAVLVSHSNVTTWPRLVQSFTAGAKSRGWAVTESSEEPGRLRVAFPDGGAVLFHLYKEIGHAGLRERFAALRGRRRPPVAVLSGSNSGSARVVAEELAAWEAGGRPAPVYLLSSGTVDDLTAIHADKTFRFGHKNSRQAKEVVRRLKKLYEEKGFDPPTVRVAVVEIADNKFACEFGGLVEEEMTRTFGKERVGVERITFPTATGGWEPSELERRSTARLARDMASAPAQSWVVVLPAPADLYRRFWLSLYESLQEVGAERLALYYDSLTFIAGDSLDFVDFAGALKPDDLHAAAIFYAQYDPRAGGKEPDAARIREALYHEIAETVLTAFAEPSTRSSPEQLRRALASYRRTPNGPTYFDGAERRGGGGPVLVRSSDPRTATERKFLFEFPAEME